MTADPGTRAVTEALATRTGTDPGDWFLVFKARYAMEVVFRALRELRGPGEVVSQIFTCSTAVDPILVAGLTPVYGDVSPASIAIDPERLVLSAATRAVVAQHTFGIVDSAGARRLRAAARGAGALLVEDSAHCVGRMARDESGAPLADVSIHSFGVEKVLPTRFGGAVWLNPRSSDPALRERVAGDLARLPVVGARLDLLTRLYRAEVGVLNRLPQAVSGPARRALTTLGAFEPAVAPAERRGQLTYPPMRPSAWMTRQIAAALPRLDDIERRRAGAVSEYRQALAGVVEVPSAMGPDDPLVRWPCFAGDTAGAVRVLDALRAAGVYAGNWYRPALFPGVEDPAVYGYTPGDQRLATSEDLVARVVNLPTTGGAAQARRVAQIVRAATAAGGSSRT
ncbi:MAG TPA: DegT/DnrJ/EryC1/StrS family aminotransferase [Cellulomonas sp.]